MRESDFSQETMPPAKSHEEILQLIQEIKDIEKNFDEIEIEEPLIQEWEAVTTDEAKPIPIKSEIDESKDKKRFSFRLKKRSRTEVKRLNIEKKYATFKIRFDEQDNLVNLDFRKPKPKSEKAKGKFKLPMNLKKLRRKGKVEAETTEEAPSEEKKGIAGKIKGILGNIGKIKNAIPGRGKKAEEAPKEETEEEE